MSGTLLFGANGNIGREICDFFFNKGNPVIAISRKEFSSESCSDFVVCDVLNSDIAKELKKIYKNRKFDAVCFAQGLNVNDSIYDFDVKQNLDLYEANCLYIAIAVQSLIKADLLEKNTKICIISSIWQNIARQNKMSYCITKSALKGLVNSMAVDLAKDGFLVNAILPGALDTEMTRNNLSLVQLEKLQSFTMFNRLANIKDVASLTYFLCSADNTSITGQFINVDLGFENAKII